jgi:hypothetical protein
MLQSSVTNVLSVFSDVYCKCVYLDVAYISHICCKYFYLDVAYISHICCKCFYLNVAYVCNDFQVFFRCFRSMFQVFICLLLYVTSVVSGCYKSRSNECSIFPSGRCESDFQRCFSNPRQLVAVGKPHPCNSGLQRRVAALDECSGDAGPTWAYEMAREADR